MTSLRATTTLARRFIHPFIVELFVKHQHHVKHYFRSWKIRTECIKFIKNLYRTYIQVRKWENKQTKKIEGLRILVVKQWGDTQGKQGRRDPGGRGGREWDRLGKGRSHCRYPFSTLCGPLGRWPHLLHEVELYQNKGWGAGESWGLWSREEM